MIIKKAAKKDRHTHTRTQIERRPKDRRERERKRGRQRGSGNFFTRMQRKSKWQRKSWLDMANLFLGKCERVCACVRMCVCLRVCKLQMKRVKIMLGVRGRGVEVVVRPLIYNSSLRPEEEDAAKLHLDASPCLCPLPHSASSHNSTLLSSLLLSLSTLHSPHESLCYIWMALILHNSLGLPAWRLPA